MRLARIKLRLAWGAAGVAIGALLLFTWIAGANHASSFHHQRAVAAERVHFWQMVDGSETSATGNVAEANLAIDLRKALGPHNPEANLPKSITGFYGDSDLYGPARSALGFNPFTGASGPLTSPVKSKLLLIKRGQIQSVIASEQPVDHGKPLGWWLPVVLLVLWLAWGLIPWVLRRHGEGLRLKRNYPDEYRLCRELRGIIKELEPGTAAYTEAYQSLNDLQAIMRGDESLEAQEVLRQARVQITARKNAAQELDQLGS
jgi:hypothetical protein